MKITLEQIDLIRKRTNASYKEAKEALERFDGNEVEALAYLEENGKFTKTERKDKTDMMKRLKELYNKGNLNKFVVSKDNKIVLNVPINLVILVALITNYMFAIAMVLLLLLGYKFDLVNSTKNEDIKFLPKEPVENKENTHEVK